MGTEVLPEFAELVAEIGEVPVAEVTPEKRFADDLGLDSLAVVEIAVAVKEKWGIRIGTEDLSTYRTVQDVLDRIASESVP